MSETINAFIAAVAKKNPNEPEFLQAVKEVAETVIPFIEKTKNTRTKCFWNAWWNRKGF